MSEIVRPWMVAAPRPRGEVVEDHFRAVLDSLDQLILIIKGKSLSTAVITIPSRHFHFSYFRQLHPIHR